MSKYIKRPIPLEAVQWFKYGDHSAVVDLEHDEGDCRICTAGYWCHDWIDTLEGGHIVCPSDWILTGTRGEHWPVKNDIFKETYEPAA